MKLYVKVVGNNLIHPTSDYVFKYPNFDLDCIGLKRNFGVLRDTYELHLKGTKENIIHYLSYLRMKNFKIK